MDETIGDGLFNNAAERLQYLLNTCEVTSDGKVCETEEERRRVGNVRITISVDQPAKITLCINDDTATYSMLPDNMIDTNTPLEGRLTEDQHKIVPYWFTNGRLDHSRENLRIGDARKALGKRGTSYSNFGEAK